MFSDWVQHCGAAFATNKSVMVSLLTGGLVGSFTHCAGMCGPFVLSQTTARLAAVPAARGSEWARLRGAALMPYHAGRITTYALLGVAAAALAVPLRALSWFHSLAAILLGLAAVLFLIQAVRQLGVLLPNMPSLSLPGFTQPMLQRLFAAPTGWRGYILGLILGLLPCGLVYAALMIVTAKADPLLAALGMAVFGLATMPSLLLVGIGGQFVTGRWRAVMRYVAPLVMGANAFVLFMVAGGYWK